MRCGALVSVKAKNDPKESARLDRERLLRKHNLSDMQKQILAAAVSGGDQIFVVGTNSGTEGEVKAGDQRFYGNEAVVAVATLVGPGLISPQGDDCFRLTSDGSRLAQTLEVKQPT